MHLQTVATLVALATPVFFVIDMTWLGLVARNFYRAEMGALLRTEFNWVAAFSFYFLFIIGLVLFVIHPAVQKGDWQYALLWGALFGFMTYATYDLTNLATLVGWSTKLAFVDMAWGTVLAASVSVVTFFLYTRVF